MFATFLETRMAHPSSNKEKQARLVDSSLDQPALTLTLTLTPRVVARHNSIIAPFFAQRNENKSDISHPNETPSRPISKNFTNKEKMETQPDPWATSPTTSPSHSDKMRKASQASILRRASSSLLSTAIRALPASSSRHRGKRSGSGSGKGKGNGNGNVNDGEGKDADVDAGPEADADAVK